MTQIVMHRKLRQLLAAWWNETPDGWLLDFLESRGVLVWIKRVIVGIGAVLALIEALDMYTPAGPQHAVTRLLGGMLAVGILGWTLWWLLRPWPTPKQSLWLVGMADVAITLACWLDAVPLAGLAATSAFVLTGAYLTFFHSPKAQAAHVGWAASTIVTLAIAVGVAPELGGWALAVATGLLFLTATGVLPVLQLGFWTVRQNATDSLVDPLTGLANRRGLDHQLGQLPTTGSRRSVCVFAIDLDNFKIVNDRYGHPIGDRVLKQIAACTQTTMGAGTLIARTGGEEFIAIDVLDPSSAPLVAERLRRAIATATDPPVTASIGVTVAPARDFPSSEEIATALMCADNAMYGAKRQGGNTVTVHTPETNVNGFTKQPSVPVHDLHRSPQPPPRPPDAIADHT